MALSRGTRLGEYEVVSLIGSGGMGEVYRARDTRLGREAALKVLPEAAILDPERRERFSREARAVAALNHPNIVTIYGVSEIGSTMCLAMELVGGQPLSASIPVGGVPSARLLPLAIQLADAVSAAHQQGVIHRDLKPANVMVTNEGRVKVLDFGLARLKEQAVGSALTTMPRGPGTAEGRILGTVAYMSPEQAEGRVVDYRSDIFSLGIVLYEMATGQAPFRGDSSLAILSAILTETPASVSDVNPALPRELARLIRRCLAKDPEQRYQSAKDLRNDLEELKREIESGEVVSGQAAAPTRPPIARRPRRRPPAVAGWVAGGFVLVGLAFGGWLLTTRLAQTPKLTSTAVPPEASSELDPKRVVVARFENRTGDPSLDPFGAVAQDYVTTGLSRVPELDTVSMMMPLLAGQAPTRTTAGAGAEGTDPARALADDTGAGTVVTGAYYLVGDSLQVQARVLDGRTGKLLAAIDNVSGPRSAAMTTLDTLRQRVMGAMASRVFAELWGSIVYPTAKPPLYDAYREYLAGWDLWVSDFPGAIRHLERAVALDPDLFMAQFIMAEAYTNLDEDEKAGAIIDRLYETRDRFGQRERLMIDWQRSALEGRRMDALARLRDLERMAPHDLVVKYLIGVSALSMNRPAESLQALTAVLPAFARSQISGVKVLPFVRGAQAYHMLGKYAEELQLVREGRADLPQAHRLRVGEARALTALGRLDDLDRLIAETAALPGAGQAPGDVMEEAAAELRVHGHREEALALAGRAVAWRQGLAPQAATAEAARYGLARALYQAERWQEARALFAKLALEHPDNLAYKRHLGTVAARLGDRAEAAHVSQEFERMTGRYLRGDHSYCRAVIAALLGKREEAVALLRRAFAEGHACTVTEHHDMDLEPLRGYPPFQELMRPKS